MKVSVVIPAYNRAALLPECIQSVRKQSRPADEIIVVDDGSTDGTGDVALQLGCTLVQQVNRGLAAARNAGAREASGEALFFLDSDDLLLPHALETCHDHLVTANAHVVVPNYKLEDQTASRQALSITSPLCLRRADVRWLLKRNFLAANAMVRRSVVQHYFFDESLRSVEDLDLWLGLLLNGYAIDVLPDCQVIKREGSIDRLSTDLGPMRRNRLRVFVKVSHRPDLDVAEKLTLRWRIATNRLGLRLADAGTRKDLVGYMASRFDASLTRWVERCQRRLAHGERTRFRP